MCLSGKVFWGKRTPFSLVSRAEVWSGAVAACPPEPQGEAEEAAPPAKPANESAFSLVSQAEVWSGAVAACPPEPQGVGGRGCPAGEAGKRNVKCLQPRLSG